MEWFGINNLIRLATVYNYARRGKRLRARKRLFRRDFERLLADNGKRTGTPILLRDGWAIDESRSLPFLDKLLVEAEHYIAERGGQPPTKGPRGFIRDILVQEDLSRFPSFLDFATSSEMLATVGNYLGYVPQLSDHVPPGVRFVESTIDGQLDDGIYRTSQLYHLDFHDSPLVYVIVLLRDVTVRSGPFTFLSASTSKRVARATKYGRRHQPYRLADEVVNAEIDRESEEHVFTYPAGTVLFLDSSRCMHFGSRDAEITRYQLMLAYVSPCRTDFSDVYLEPRVYPIAPGDSELRRIVLDRNAV